MQAGHRHDMTDAGILQRGIQRFILIQVCPVPQQHGFHKMGCIFGKNLIHFFAHRPVQPFGKAGERNALPRRNPEAPCGVGNEIDILCVIVVIGLSIAHVGGRKPEFAGNDRAGFKPVQAAAPVIKEHTQSGTFIELDLCRAVILRLSGIAHHRGAQLKGLAVKLVGGHRGQQVVQAKAAQPHGKGEQADNEASQPLSAQQKERRAQNQEQRRQKGAELYAQYGVCGKYGGREGQCRYDKLSHLHT